MEGAGSRTAIEENEAVMAGFSSWGDRKARACIASQVTSLPAELTAFIDAEQGRRLPEIAVEPPDVDAEALIGMICELSLVDAEYRGIGVDLAFGCLFLAAAIDLGYKWDRAGIMARDLANSFPGLGGGDGLSSYMQRLFASHGSVRFESAWKADAPLHDNSYYGVLNSSGSIRDVVLLDTRTSRAETRIEKRGRTNISVFGGSNLDTEYDVVTSTTGRFVLTVNEGAACLALYNQRKAITKSHKEARQPDPSRKTENLNDFPSREMYSLNNFNRMERTGQGARRGWFCPETAKIAPNAIDERINGLRKNLVPKTAAAVPYSSPVTPLLQPLFLSRNLSHLNLWNMPPIKKD
jgi:hypothetical protein